MDLDRARTDAELARHFLVGGAGQELRQDFAFAPGQGFAPGEFEGDRFRRRLVQAKTPRRDCIAHARRNRGSAERLLDKIQRAVPDGVYGHRNVALPGDYENRRRVVSGVEILEDVESGAAGNVNIEQDTG